MTLGHYHSEQLRYMVAQNSFYSMMSWRLKTNKTGKTTFQNIPYLLLWNHRNHGMRHFAFSSPAIYLATTFLQYASGPNLLLQNFCDLRRLSSIPKRVTFLLPQFPTFKHKLSFRHLHARSFLKRSLLCTSKTCSVGNNI